MNKKKKVKATDVVTGAVEIYDSAADAARAFSVKDEHIRRCPSRRASDELRPPVGVREMKTKTFCMDQAIESMNNAVEIAPPCWRESTKTHTSLVCSGCRNALLARRIQDWAKHAERPGCK